MTDEALFKAGRVANPSNVLLVAMTICALLLAMVVVRPPVPLRPSDALRETHAKLGLDESKSNLKDQFSPEHRSVQAKVPSIKSLWVYPVKSCKGIEVTKTKVVPSGLEFDRMYTLAHLKKAGPAAAASDDPDKRRDTWEIITQRQFPLLATVEVELWQPDLTKLRNQDFKAGDSFLVLRFPWQDAGLKGWLSLLAARGMGARAEKEILLPVSFPSKEVIKSRGYTNDPVKISNVSLPALNMGSELPPELPLYLGVKSPIGLFRINPDMFREVLGNSPTKDFAGYQPVVKFQDEVRVLSPRESGFPSIG